jgi:acetyl esterase
MPVDTELAALMEQLPPFDPTLSPAEVRANARARRPLGAGDPTVAVRDLTFDGPGGRLGARHYLPPARGESKGLLVFFHGGGFVLGDLESHDSICRDLAAQSGVAVLAVDYRLAPEHPFPAAVEDAWAALCFAHDHADDLGTTPNDLAVGGDSAGGNLAAVVALMARDAHLPLRLQLLVYPVVDLRHGDPSFEENSQGYFLTADAMAWFEGHYAADVNDWRASPVLAPNLAGVAPAVVLTCEYDPLRDEGDRYARLLAAAGVPVVHHSFAGLIHGSLGMNAVVPAAAALMEHCATALRSALAGTKA